MEKVRRKGKKEKAVKLNLTDKDAKFMKERIGVTRANYNAQIAASEDQIIVAAEVVKDAGDRKQFREKCTNGFSQSFLREDSLAIAIFICSLITFVFKNLTKSNTSSRKGSGTCSISFISNSFLFMPLLYN